MMSGDNSMRQMNVAAICIMTIAMLLMSAASLLADQDSIEILSVDAQDGAVLKTGTVVKVTIRYNLSSAEVATLVADSWAGTSISESWSTRLDTNNTVGRGKGVVTRSFTVPDPWMTDSIDVGMWTNGVSIYKKRDMTLRWVDPKFADVQPNPAYKGITVIVNPLFPNARKLYESLLGDGVSTVHWDEYEVPRFEMKISEDVNIEAAQSILDMCLECTTNISNVRMTGTGYNSGESRRIYIGCKDTLDFQPLPLATLKKLADSNTSPSEFRKILQEWNCAQTLAKDKRDRERFLQERKKSSGVYNDFVSSELPTNVPTNGLVAFYKLAKDRRDSLGVNNAISTQETEFQSDGLYLNGLPRMFPPPGYSAYVSLKTLRYEQFAFSLNFKPMDFDKWKPERKEVRSAIVSFGAVTNRWMALHRSDNGNLELTLNDREFKHEFDHAPLLTNEWNCVTFAFDMENRKACFFLNGNRLPDVSLPEDFTLKVIGSEDHFLNKAIGFGNRTTDELFHGYLRNVLLYDIALPPEELSALHHAMAGKPQ